MLAQNNQDIQEAVVTVYQLTQEEKIRQQCEAREDYYRRQNDVKRYIQKQDDTIRQQTEQIQQLTVTINDLQKKVAELQKQCCLFGTQRYDFWKTPAHRILCAAYLTMFFPPAS